MVTSRGAFFLGLSLIICVAMVIYGPQIGRFRYLTVPTNQGLFILDTKNQMMNLCTDKVCRTVPHEASSMGIPGMYPTYGQISMMPVSSLGSMDNGGVMPNFGCGYNQACMVPLPQQCAVAAPVQTPTKANGQQPQIEVEVPANTSTKSVVPQGPSVQPIVIKEEIMRQPAPQTQHIEQQPTLPHPQPLAAPISAVAPAHTLPVTAPAVHAAPSTPTPVSVPVTAMPSPPHQAPALAPPALSSPLPVAHVSAAAPAPAKPTPDQQVNKDLGQLASLIGR